MPKKKATRHALEKMKLKLQALKDQAQQLEREIEAERRVQPTKVGPATGKSAT